MPRLRQLYPLAYLTNTAINGEFEQVIRYLNAAELGNKTLAELLSLLFDASGNLTGAVELRLDAEQGLQYRIGVYADDTTGWRQVAPLEDLRGMPGANVGDLVAPVFYGRMDVLCTVGQLDVPFAFLAGETLMVFKNGLLQREGVAYDYVVDSNVGTSGGFVFNSPLSDGDMITAFKVRTEVLNAYQRVDFDVIAPQTIFPITYNDTADITVYKNGVLLRNNVDYVANGPSTYISMLSPITPGNLISIVKFENSLSQTVSGFMMEKDYVNASTGLLDYSRLGINDGDIAQAKVSGLPAALSSRVITYVSNTEPANPATPSLWLHTAQATPPLYYYNGLSWVLVNPENRLPAFGPQNVHQMLRVSSSGSGLEWGSVDLSGYIPTTRIGASNGVPALDSSGRLTKSQLPEVQGTQSFYFKSGGSIVNGTYVVHRPYKQRLRITALALRTSSGTGTVTLTVGGTAMGSSYTASSTPSEFALGSTLTVDAIASSQSIGFKLENANATNDLEVTIVAEVINV